MPFNITKLTDVEKVKKLKIAIHGNSGTSKTRMAINGLRGKTLIINTDHGLSSVDDISGDTDVVNITKDPTKIEEHVVAVKEVLDALSFGELVGVYDTVVFDIFTLYSAKLALFLQEALGKEWGLAYTNAINDKIQQLVSLDCNVIVLFHSAPTVRNGIEVDGPAIVGVKGKEKIVPSFDTVMNTVKYEENNTGRFTESYATWENVKYAETKNRLSAMLDISRIGDREEVKNIQELIDLWNEKAKKGKDNE